MRQNKERQAEKMGHSPQRTEVKDDAGRDGVPPLGTDWRRQGEAKRFEKRKGLEKLKTIVLV